MGHELVCVANLRPAQNEEGKNEIDSFMYQSVGVEIVPQIAQCLGVPLVQAEITGKSLNQDLYYAKAEESKEEETDEVEDLFNLLTQVKTQHGDVAAVASGAILSNYQRLRVENCCQRLGLISLAYLWNRNQHELLDDMIKANMQVQIVKICSIGLRHDQLGKSIVELRDYFHHLATKYDFNVCGEGGEYESVVFDCPLFKTHKVVSNKQAMISHDDNQESPVAYLAYGDFALVEKTDEEKQVGEQFMNALIQHRQNVDHSWLLNQAQPQLPQFQAESNFDFYNDSVVLQKI
jgi:diphthine-ammonia ligase